MKTYWSNCAIEAFRHKLSRAKDTEVMVIYKFPFHFHMLWFDKRSNVIKHFTYRSVPGCHCDILFRGRVETMSKENLEQLLKKSFKQVFL